MKTLTTLILTLAILITTAQTIHVTPTGAGAGTGTNWDNATTLETAVSIATSGTSIWIQTGTYNLSATLVIPQEVSVYGGFAGTETALAQRNFAQNRTILDANNNFAAVTMEPNSVLSGVTIQNGVANIPSRMDGGGVLMRAGARLEHSYIMNNVAAHRGGGIFAEANTEIFSSVIADNRAGLSGFAVSSSGEMLVLNNTVVGNTPLGCDPYQSVAAEKNICPGETVTLSASQTGTFLWSTGDTTSAITTPVLTENTTFTVAITMPNFCVVTDTFHVIVDPLPTAVTITQVAGCGEVTLNATGGTGGTIYWQDTTSDGTSQATPSTSQTVTTTGTYFFRAKSVAGCWGAQDSVIVSTIAMPHTLVLTSEVGTNVQTVAQGRPITTIRYDRGGGATGATIAWTGTANADTRPSGVSVWGLTTGTSVSIYGSLSSVPGTFGFTITTTPDTTACTPVSVTGILTATTSCNSNTPSWGSSLDTITWGNTSNTNIESGTTTVAGTDGRPTQIWSGAVFATACAKGNANSNNSFSGGVVGNHYADCRQTLHTFNAGRAAGITGDLFSWCALKRFADQLCPAPWRVPTTEDFAILHQNLGYTLPVPGDVVDIIPNTYMGMSGTVSASTIGGTWGGARFTGSANLLSSANSFYWSSSERGAVNVHFLLFSALGVVPQTWLDKSNGFALRCVRDE